METLNKKKSYISLSSIVCQEKSRFHVSLVVGNKAGMRVFKLFINVNTDFGAQNTKGKVCVVCDKKVNVKNLIYSLLYILVYKELKGRS